LKGAALERCLRTLGRDGTGERTLHERRRLGQPLGIAKQLVAAERRVHRRDLRLELPELLDGVAVAPQQRLVVRRRHRLGHQSLEHRVR
jgi:hypothetical protein